jgi:hypothetical protein
MHARFVPSYYARYLINKLQQLKQGAKSVEEYYQKLQIGMLRCNLEEREDATMAQFFVGLNHEIHNMWSAPCLVALPYRARPVAWLCLVASPGSVAAPCKWSAWPMLHCSHTVTACLCTSCRH